MTSNQLESMDRCAPDDPIHVAIYTRYWKIGGIERIIAYLVKGLTPLGYRFSIITESPPDPDAQFDLGPETPVFSRNLSPFDPEAEAQLRRLVQRINPDVAMAMGSSRAIYKLARSLQGTDIPVIHSEHNTPEHIMESLHHSEEFLTALRNSCDYLHVLLDEFAEAAPHPDRVRVSGNPVIQQTARCDVRDNPADADPNTILFLGRYDWKQKQPQILVEAFASLADKYPHWRVDLYGDDWNGGRERLEKLVTRLGLGTKVRVMDFQEDIQNLFHQAKFLAFPSAFEGWGLSASEALSHGLPVVAFADCAGVNRLVVDQANGVLAQGSVNDATAFAAALEVLMQDEAMRMALGANGPQSMRQFALPEFIRKWDRLFKDAAALKGRNLLGNLSPIEAEYLAVLTSGRLFDRAAGFRKQAAEFRTTVMRLEKLRNRGFLARSFYAVLTGTEQLVFRAILKPKLFKKYQRQRAAFFADSKHSWLVNYGRKFS